MLKLACGGGGVVERSATVGTTYKVPHTASSSIHSRQTHEVVAGELITLVVVADDALGRFYVVVRRLGLGQQKT